MKTKRPARTFSEYIRNEASRYRKRADIARAREERDTRKNGGMQSCDAYYYEMLSAEGAAFAVEAIAHAFSIYKTLGKLTPKRERLRRRKLAKDGA